MTYVANTRIKTGTWKDEKDGETYIEPGEPVDFKGDELDALIAAKAVVDKKDYEEQVAPEVYNQAPGTPSNLAEVEGTELQMNLPEAGEDSAPPVPDPVNPADPPEVKKAGDPGDGSDSRGQDVKDKK